MLKVNDYCFKCDFSQIISIYQVTEIVDEIVDEPRIMANLIDTTSGLRKHWLYPRTASHYTKCSSTTIEELKEEFPEVFI
jgi:hypothetical protein